MVESDCSETEEGDMDKLQLSSDSVDTTLQKKRPRIEDSEEEINLPAKRHQSPFNEQSKKILKNDVETILDKNDTDAYNIKEEEYILCPEKEQNVQEIFDLSNSNMGKENKEKHDGKLKHENGNESKNPEEVNIKKIIVENKHSSCEKSATNTSVMSTYEDNQIKTEDNEVFKEEIDKMLDRKEDGLKGQMRTDQETKRRTVDTEVVDGLELSVECASDKEDSSSESEKEKNAKPRPKTIIIKAEPNESELDCSSEREKSDSQQVTNTLEIKSQKSRAKRRGSRKSFSKLKASGSEDSQNSNSDEDYNPRTKKKTKKSPTAKKSTNKHHSIESKRGGKSIKRNSPRKNVNDRNVSDEDVYATVTKKTDETKTETEEELSEKEFSSKSSSDNNSEKEENSMKGRRKHSSTKPQDKRIQALKKYLSIAGVKIKSYNDIWADCKSNAAKIKRLKELLEKNGVSGRPTLEKCKRVRKKKEKLKEVSELDTSNIISEGRITRARRNMENLKKTSPDTPPRHREARNTFKRIQTVVDIESDSE